MLLRHIIWMDTEGEMKLLKSHSITIPSWYNTFEHSGHFLPHFCAKSAHFDIAAAFLTILWGEGSHSWPLFRHGTHAAAREAFLSGKKRKIHGERSGIVTGSTERWCVSILESKFARKWFWQVIGAFGLVLSSDRMMKTCHSRTSHSQFHQVQNLKNLSQLLR